MCTLGCQGEGEARASGEEAWLSCPPSPFLRISSLPHPPINVSLGSQPPFFSFPPVQAVLFISSGPLFGFRLNGPCGQ